MAPDVPLADRLMVLIDRLYGAADSDTDWRTVLEDVVTEVGDSAAQAIFRECLAGGVQISETASTSTGHLGAYDDHPYADDFYRCAVAGSLQAPRRVTGVRQPLGSSERALLEALLPHLRTALQLHRRLAGATAMATTLLSALDRLHYGVVLTTAAGRVGHLNRAARSMLASPDGLTLEGSELRAEQARDTTTIREAIRSAAKVGQRATSSGRRLSIGRPSGRVAYVMVIAPSGRTSVDLLHPDPMVVTVTITDPDRCATTSPAHVSAALGVTLAEARVGLQLLAGASTVNIASALRVNLSTVRSHLRHLFVKTGTTRQADLVRVLRTIVPPLVD